MIKYWVGRPDILGASQMFYQEHAEEDPLEYKRHNMWMSVGKLNELLRLVEPYISKADTLMRRAVPASTISFFVDF